MSLATYEFGVKASLAVTHKEGFVVGAMSCPENPYDGHTLERQLEQVEQLTGRMPPTTFVDKGYKGHGVDPGRSAVLISGTRTEVPYESSEKSQIQLGFARNRGAWILTTGLG